MTTNELTMLWAKIKSYFTNLFVKKTDFANYDPLIEDTRTSASAVITANAPFATLEDGQRIILRLKYNSNDAMNLRLTLSDGSLTDTYPLYTSMYTTGNVQAGVGGVPLRAGQYLHLIFDSDGQRWKTIGDVDQSRGFPAYDSTTIKSTTNTNTGTVSAKILHEEFATNTALEGKADKVEVVNVVPQTGMLPNVVYSLGTTDSVTVTLDTSDTSTELKIYCFTFTAETSACQVTLPATVELGNEYEWEFAAGRKFEVSIMDNVALVAYVDTQTTNS